MAQGYKVSWLNVTTICYGELNDTSNFEIVCEDEDHDDIWCNGVDEFTENNLTWENVVLYLQGFYPSNILEITAV